MTSKSSAYTALVVSITLLVLLSIISPAYSGVIAQSRNNGADLRRGALSLHVYPDGRFYVKYGNENLTYAGPTTYLSIRIGKYVFTNYNGMLSLSWLQSPTKVVGDSAITVWVINNTVKIIQNLTLLDKAVLVKLKLVGGAPDINARYIVDIVSSTSRKPLLIVGYDTQKYTNYLRDGMSISQIYANTIIDGEPAAVGVWWDKDNTAPEKAGATAWGVATHGGWNVPNATNTMAISTAAVLYYEIPSGNEISFKVGILPAKLSAKLIETGKHNNPFIISFNKLYYYPGETGIVAIEDKAIYNEITQVTGKTGNAPTPVTTDNVEITGIVIEEGSNPKNIMLTQGSESLIGLAYATFKTPVFEKLMNHPTQITMLINIHSDTLGNYLLKVKLNLTKNLGYVTVNNRNYYVEASTDNVEDVAQNPLSSIYIITDKGQLLEPKDPIFPSVFVKVLDNILPKLGLFNKEAVLNTLKGYRPPNMALFYSYVTHENLYNFLEGTHDVIGKLIDKTFEYLEKVCEYASGLLSADQSVSPQAKEEEILADEYTRIILDAINLNERFNLHSKLTKIRVLEEFTFSSIELLASGYLTFVGLKDLHSKYIKPTKISQAIFKSFSILRTDKKLVALYAEQLSSELKSKLNEKLENLPEVVKNSIMEKTEKELINPLNDFSNLVSKEHLTLYSTISSIYKLESLRLGILLVIKGVYTQVLAKYHEEGGSLTRNSPLYSQSKILNVALSYAIKKLYDDTRQYRNLLLMANIKYPYPIVIAEEQLMYKAISKNNGNTIFVSPQTYGVMELALSSIGVNMFAHLVGANLNSATGGEDITSVLIDALAESAIDFCYAIVKSIAGEIIKEGIKTAVASVLGDAVASALGPIFIGYEVYNWLYDALGIGDMISAYNNSASLMGMASRIPDAYDASLTAAYQIHEDNLDCSAVLTLVSIRIFKLSIEFEALDILEEASHVRNVVQALANVITSLLGHDLNKRVAKLQKMKDSIREYIDSLYAVAGNAFVFVSKVYNIEPLPQTISLGENIGSITVEVSSNGKEISKSITLYTFKKNYEWHSLEINLQEATKGLVKDVNLYMIKQYWARNAVMDKDNMYMASTITFRFKDGNYIIALLPSLKNNLLMNTMSTYRAYSAKGDIRYIEFIGSNLELLANTPIGYVAYEQNPGIIEESDSDLGWMGTGLLFEGHNLPVLFVTRSLPAVIEEQVSLNFYDLLDRFGLAGAALKNLNVSFANKRLLYIVDEIKPAREYMLAGTNYDLKTLGQAIAYNYKEKIDDATSLIQYDIRRIINNDVVPVPGINAIRVPVTLIKLNGVTYFKLGIPEATLASILRTCANTAPYARIIITLEYFRNYGGTLIPAASKDFNTVSIDKTLRNYSRLISELRVTILESEQNEEEFMLDIFNQLLAYYEDKLLTLAINFVNENQGTYVIGLSSSNLPYLIKQTAMMSSLSNLVKRSNVYLMITVNDLSKASKDISTLLDAGIPARKIIISLPHISENFFYDNNVFNAISILVRLDGEGIYTTLIGLNDVGLPPTPNSTVGKVIEQLVSILNHRRLLPTSDSYASIEFYSLDETRPLILPSVKFQDTLSSVTLPVMFRGADVDNIKKPRLIAYVLGLSTSHARISQVIGLYKSYSEFAKRSPSETYSMDLDFSTSVWGTATINIKIKDSNGNTIAESSATAFGTSGYSQVFILIMLYYDEGKYHIKVFAMPLRGNDIVRSMIATGYYCLDIINGYLQKGGILATAPLAISKNIQYALTILYDIEKAKDILQNIFQINTGTSVSFTTPNEPRSSIIMFSGITLFSISGTTTLSTVTQYLSGQANSKNIWFTLNPIYVNEHYLGFPGFNSLHSSEYSVS